MNLQGASTLSHIQSSASSSSSSLTGKKSLPMKSDLRRSKSFGSTDSPNGKIFNLTDFNLTTEQIILIKRAIDNPNNLTVNQLMEIVSIICSKAMESSMNSYGLAKICITIADKDANQIFLESLVNCCREWFNEKDKLIRSTSIGSQHPKQRWLSYIAFVTELYLNLKSKHRRVKLILSTSKSKSCNNVHLDSLPEEDSEDEDGDETEKAADGKREEDKDNNDDEEDDEDDESDSSEELFNLSERQSRSLAMLLYDCCQTILVSLPTSNSTSVDIECLLSVLRSVGRLIERENVQRMNKIINLIRESYLGPLSSKLTAMSLKSLLELIEFRCSQWQFNQAQQIYYYPYTKPSQ